jgi:WD40 repeat protein
MTTHHPHLLSLSVQGRDIPLSVGTKIRDIFGLQPNSADGTVMEVNANPKDPRVLGLQNHSSRVWIVTLPDRTQRRIYPGQSVKLTQGTMINFGSIAGSIGVSRPSPVPNPVPYPAGAPPRKNTALKWAIAGGAGALLLGLLGTQIYGYNRYEAFPFNPAYAFSEPPNEFFLKKTLTGHVLPIESVTVSPDGTTLISAGRVSIFGLINQASEIKLWDLETGKNTRTHTGRYGAWFMINPDGKTFLSGTGGEGIKIWSLDTGKALRNLDGRFMWTTATAISPDGKTLFRGSGDRINLTNLETGEPIGYFPGHSSWVGLLTVSPDGTLLVSETIEGEIKSWSLTTQKELPFSVERSPVISMAISPNNKIFAFGKSDKSIGVYDATTEKNFDLLGHSGPVLSIAISPDSKTLVSGSSDMTVKAWDLETGKLLRTYSGHSGPARSVAVTPDGKSIVSAGDDKTIKIWRLP